MLNSLLSLLYSFLQIGLFSIGGGYAIIPMIKQQVVDIHHWMTLTEFTDIITISQMTPGPIAVNTSTFVGIRLAGLPGAVIATFGCIISGFIISLLLYNFFQKNQKSAYAAGVLKGLRFASLGLIISAAASILLIAFCGTSELTLSAMDINLSAVVIFAIALFLLRKYKFNPILVMCLTGVAGYFLY